MDHRGPCHDDPPGVQQSAAETTVSIHKDTISPSVSQYKLDPALWSRLPTEVIHNILENYVFKLDTILHDNIMVTFTAFESKSRYLSRHLKCYVENCRNGYLTIKNIGFDDFTDSQIDIVIAMLREAELEGSFVTATITDLNLECNLIEPYTLHNFGDYLPHLQRISIGRTVPQRSNPPLREVQDWLCSTTLSSFFWIMDESESQLFDFLRNRLFLRDPLPNITIHKLSISYGHVCQHCSAIYYCDFNVSCSQSAFTTIDLYRSVGQGGMLNSRLGM